MTVMNFPSHPNLGDEYIFNNATYIWDGVKWVAQKPNEQNMNQLLEAHKNGIDQHTISCIQGLADALANARDPVLDAKWLQKRSPMRTGYTAADGDTLPRDLYPDAFAAIQAGLVPVCTDAEWLADPAKRGCFTLGDGSTTFRVPDYNGVSAGSYGPAYLGGSAGSGGVVLRDRIQNITGEAIAEPALGGFGLTAPGATQGAFNVGRSVTNSLTGGSGGTNKYALLFDASGSARTGDTTRPITVEGCLAIKLFGAVQNAGSADAAALATAVADLAARMAVVEGKVSTLEQRKSTCLVNATGTGAPHETVVAQLPANITVNTRYVLPNPFRNNTPVICWAEVFANGKWSRTGFVYANSSGYGADASYVQGEGIVVQTGGAGLLASAKDIGSGHGIPPSTVIGTSAPCRVFVRKLEA